MPLETSNTCSRFSGNRTPTEIYFVASHSGSTKLLLNLVNGILPCRKTRIRRDRFLPCSELLVSCSVGLWNSVRFVVAGPRTAGMLRPGGPTSKRLDCLYCQCRLWTIGNHLAENKSLHQMSNSALRGQCNHVANMFHNIFEETFVRFVASVSAPFDPARRETRTDTRTPRLKTRHLLLDTCHTPRATSAPTAIDL